MNNGNRNSDMSELIAIANRRREELKKAEAKQKPQPQQQDLSKENMEQILKTMLNQEKATQEKVNAQKPQNIRKTGNQW